jgi:chemotaxis family two-component system response regulator Rcp1
MNKTNICIVLAEDNPGDVFLVRRALDTQRISYQMTLAHDGEQALELVEQAEKGELAIDVFLVDLNLPKHDAGEILTKI